MLDERGLNMASKKGTKKTKKGGGKKGGAKLGVHGSGTRPAAKK